MRWLLSLALMVSLAALAAATWADTADVDGTPPAKKDKAPRQQLTVTPEREAAVMSFIRRNHAELADLLALLAVSQPKEYERAIKDVFRVTERLALVRERDMSLYDLEVAAWSAQSRVQLLSAKLRMGDSEAVRKELRAALSAQMDARLAVLKHHREQAGQRLAKMDAEIDKLQGDREALIQRQLKSLEESFVNSGSGKAAGPKTFKKLTPGSASKPAE